MKKNISNYFKFGDNYKILNKILIYFFLCMETTTIDDLLNTKQETFSKSLKVFEKNTHLKRRTENLLNKIQLNMNSLQKYDQENSTTKLLKLRPKRNSPNRKLQNQNKMKKFDKLVCHSIDLKTISPYIDNINQTLRLRLGRRNPNNISEGIYEKFTHCNTEEGDYPKYSDIFDKEFIPKPSKPKYHPKVYLFRREPKRTIDTKNYTPNYSLIDKTVHFVKFYKPIKTKPKMKKLKPICNRFPKLMKEIKKINDYNLTNSNKVFKFENYTPRKEFGI